MSEKLSKEANGGWVVFSAIGIFNVAQGLVLILFGGEAVHESVESLVGVSWPQLVATSPSFAAYINDLLGIVGLFLAAFGFMVFAIASTGYKRLRPWAWYSMWIAPVFYLLTAMILFAKGEIYYADDLSFELFTFLLVLGFLVQVAEARSFRIGRPKEGELS